MDYDSGVGEEKSKDVLNRSRRDRLTKAAKQGYGPWAHELKRSSTIPSTAARHPQQQDSAAALESRTDAAQDSRHPAAVSEHAPRAPLLKQRRASLQRRPLEEELDVDGFLAPKPPGAAAQTKVQRGNPVSALVPHASRLEVKITTGGISDRALAAKIGVRPKAAAKAAVAGTTVAEARRLPDEQPPLDPRRSPARLSSKAGRGRYDDDDDTEQEDVASSSIRVTEHLDRSRSRQERRQQRREERKKREEWRRAWKEDRRKKAGQQNHPQGEGDSSSGSDEPQTRDGSPQRHRAASRASPQTVGSVAVVRDPQVIYAGQVTDAVLERRLREQQETGSRSERLMSEAEVLAKLNRKRDNGVHRNIWHLQRP